MKVGVMYQGLPRERLSTTARWVEDLGFDSLWAGDHVLSYVDGLSAALAFGVATERLTVGTAILLAPLRNPALLARTLATMGEELPGRLVVGLGAGGDIPAEFAVVGAEHAGRGRRVEETIHVVRQALDEGVLGGHPFVDRPPGGAPPFWLGGRSPAAARRAGRLASGFVPYLVVPDHYAQLREEVTQELAARGDVAFTWGADVMVAIDADGRRAWDDALAYRAYGLDEERLARHTVSGTPERCLEGLLGFREVGVEHFVLHIAAPPHRKRAHIEQLASLLPALQAA